MFTGSTWSSVAGLPHHLLITATRCRDWVYVMGYHGHTYTSSLATLLSTRPTFTPPTHSTWHQLNTAPVEAPTLSTISSQVVAVGGRRGDTLTNTADVHGLVSGRWTRIVSMNTGRTFPIVAVVNGFKMVVVGSSLPPPPPPTQ